MKAGALRGARAGGGGIDPSAQRRQGAPAGVSGQGAHALSVDVLRVLPVDHEIPALQELAQLLRQHRAVGGVERAASAHNGAREADDEAFDAIFLQIRVPELDGHDLAQALTRAPHSPAVVFVRGFDNGSVAMFELHALGQLVTPVANGRIEEALKRAEAGARAPVAGGVAPALQEPPGQRDVIAVHDLRARAVRLLARSAILYIRAHGDYVRVYADSGRYLLRSSLIKVERRFTPEGFLRVHRQYLANLSRAVEVGIELNGTATLRFENGDAVPVARRHVAELRRRLTK